MKDTTWSAAHEASPARSAPPNGRMVRVLVGAAFLGVLACMVLAGINYATLSSARNRAIVMISRMRESLELYKEKYLKLPLAPTDETTAVESRGAFLSALLAEDEVANPEKIPFLDQPAVLTPNERVFRNTAGELEQRDPWGNLLRLHVDVNGDGKIPNPSGGADGGAAEISALPAGFVIYSAGPDRDYGTWKDNLKTWEKEPEGKGKKKKVESGGQ